MPSDNVPSILARYRIEKRGPYYVVVEIATDKSMGKYKTFKGAWIKRKSLARPGITYNQARGLPS